MPAGPLPRTQKKASRVFFGVAMAELAKGGLWVNVLSLPIFFFLLIPGSWNSHKEDKQWLPELQLSLRFFIVSKRLKGLPGWLQRGLNLGEHSHSSRALPHSAKAIPLTNANLTLGPRALQLISASESGLWVKRFDGKDLKLDMGLGHILPPETRASLQLFRCEYISCSVSWI